MHLYGQTVPFSTVFFLLLALGLALSFEFVNGFHDTANAVATVIYTHTLKPVYAVVWSGIWNLIGVLTSSGLVAFGVVALLPVELVLNVGSGAGFAMVFSLLISAIIWNVGTWYLGLPASSSHTLIGSIMGVGLANSMLSGRVFGEGVNWAKASEVGMSLLISPLVGFGCSALLLLLSKALIKNKELYSAPPKDQPPPKWIRGLLMLTSFCRAMSIVLQLVLAFAQEGVASHHVVASANRGHGARFPFASFTRGHLGLLGEPAFFLLARRDLIGGRRKMGRHLGDEAIHDRLITFWFRFAPMAPE